MKREDECQAAQGRDQLEGRYANYFKVGYNEFEFLIDFGQFYPEQQSEQLHTRIVTNPVYAKSLFDLLRDSIDKYEGSFGTIPKEG